MAESLFLCVWLFGYTGPDPGCQGRSKKGHVVCLVCVARGCPQNPCRGHTRSRSKGWPTVLPAAIVSETVASALHFSRLCRSRNSPLIERQRAGSHAHQGSCLRAHAFLYRVAQKQGSGGEPLPCLVSYLESRKPLHPRAEWRSEGLIGVRIPQKGHTTCSNGEIKTRRERMACGMDLKAGFGLAGVISRGARS